LLKSWSILALTEAMAGKPEEVPRLHSAAFAGNSQPLLGKDAPAKSGMGGTGTFVAYILASILSSVFIVLCNKEVFARGFAFPLTVSFIAYVFTWLYYVALRLTGAFVPVKSLPVIENVKVALASISSISFMNLCLLTNTVSIYQICKFATIPCTLVIQKTMYGVNTNWRILMSLTMVLGGVGYATFKGLEAGNLQAKGVIFAVLAVVSTSVYRIWQETKQKEFKMNPTDFQATMAGWQALLGLPVAMLVEFLPLESSGDWTKTVPHYMHAVMNGGQEAGLFPDVCKWLLGVSVFALAVNFTSFGLIGKGGPITYAVVGHAKTVLTIAMGIVMFRSADTAATIRADIIGCAVALIGVIGYGHFEYKAKNNQPDIIEQNFPGLCGKAQAKAVPLLP